MLFQGLITLIAATPAIRVLVGNRVYPTVVPKTLTPVYPIIVYQDVSASTDVALDLSAINYKRLQFDCRSTSYVDTKTLQNALHNLFDALNNVTLSDGTRLKYVECGVDIDLFDKDDMVYRAVSDWTFQF